jgi:predicted nucleotidyltransferase
MPNLIELIGTLAEMFTRLQIRFAVGGALANNYWGIVRTTQDIDCLIALPAIKYQLFADGLTAIGCVLPDDVSEEVPITVPRLVKQVQDHKYIECFHNSVRIELFVPAVPLQEEILRRAIVVDLGGHRVPITTAEDLILLKIAFHRIKDLLDVRGILWVQRGKLNLEYLSLWSQRSLEPEAQNELEQLIAEYAKTSPDNVPSGRSM